MNTPMAESEIIADKVLLWIKVGMPKIHPEMAYSYQLGLQEASCRLLLS